jgi:hypothetical protein
MIETKTIQLIHLAFCIAVCLFGALVLMISSANLYFSIEFNQDSLIVLIAPLFAIICIALSNFLFNSLMNQVDKSASAMAKFQKYQAAFLVKCALLEGAALFNIVVCLVTNNAFTLLFAALCLVVLWLNRPTKNHISEALQLQESELN